MLLLSIHRRRRREEEEYVVRKKVLLNESIQTYGQVRNLVSVCVRASDEL